MTDDLPGVDLDFGGLTCRVVFDRVIEVQSAADRTEVIRVIGEVSRAAFEAGRRQDRCQERCEPARMLREVVRDERGRITHIVDGPL